MSNMVGIDGFSPVYNPDGLWQMWSINQIYRGTIGEKKYVPKKKDYVIDPDTYTMYIVDDLDTITLIPTLREIRPSGMSFSFTQTDVLFGTGPGTQADTYRVYIDKTVLPHTLAVDSRLKVGGSMTSYAKIFKGSVLNDTGKVVSKVIDSNGEFVSENVPLELVAIDSHVNYSIKVVPVCHTNESLVDGEIVTAVFYSDNGHVVSKRQLLVENTSFIRGVDHSKKYITHISLVSPFLSQSDNNTIEYPLNIPIDSLNLIGRVHYSTGETLELPVNDTKFKMYGLEQFVSTIIGQKLDLVLSYQLSENESSFAGVGVDAKYITQPYNIVTVNPNNSYTVKLFGYPVWIDEVTGYQMQWYLFNLDRNTFFNVTSHVRFDENTGSFDPKGYGYLQKKQVSINLRNVSGSYKPFIHTQVVDINLNDPITDPNTYWTVSHEAAHSRPAYGVGLFAKKIDNRILNISSGITSFDTWIERLYKNTYPLINPNTELDPVRPTHFVLTHKGTSTEYVVADWNKNINTASDILEYETVTIQFIRNVGSGVMPLSMAALLVKD